jgi:hypothetical protein
MCGAVVVAVVLAVSSSPGAGAAAPDEFFGVNAGDLFELEPSEWDAQLEAIRQGGIDTVRLPAVWSNLEPSPPDGEGRHSYSWELIDDRVAALAQHGLRWEPVICFTATWDESIAGDDTSAPTHVDAFAEFAAALAGRYGPGGSFWKGRPDIPAVPVRDYELWNEPNAAAFWHPQGSAPETYARLFTASRDAIRGVDASARVVVGGLASPGDGVLGADQFVARMFVSHPELRGNVDAVGYHPYAPTLAGVYRQLAAFRRAVDRAAGPGIPIQITEVGWTTTDTTEDERAAALGALARTLPHSDCGVDRLMPYAWIGPEQDPGDRLQWFGIQNRTGSPKPSATAYTRAARSAGVAGASTTRLALCRPRLRLGLRTVAARAGGRPRLNVNVSCAAACALSLRVTAGRPAGSGRTIARRALRFRRSHRNVRLSLSPAARPGSRIALRARGWTRAGWRATRIRTVHVPR